MTPDSISTEPQPVPTARSTDGMTTKVVKGSIWTLAGQVAPLGVSIFTTPFVIRMLGAEGYGVLILVGLIPTYFVFADFGMGIASTKFGSEAYAAGDNDNEARIIRTAALIALLTSTPFAIGIFIFSNSLIGAFNIPEALRAEADFALKLTSITFVINFLNGIFNTPQLTRLRMDLNTKVNAGLRISGLIAIPFVIHFGGGIAGISITQLLVATLTLAANVFVSGHLLKNLFESSLNYQLIRPMLKFGGGWLVALVAGIFLVNAEKLVLTKVTSVKALAFYSVAFTLASMASLLSNAMTQSLIPAFSQLIVPSGLEQLSKLYGRSLRLNVLAILPMVLILFVIANPFFTMWAGPEFGLESSMPFYILLIGVLFNLVSIVPGSLLLADGRSGLLAKLYWAELIPYVCLVAILTANFGAVGAALAWSIRFVTDAILVLILVRRKTLIRLVMVKGQWLKFILAIAVLIFPSAFVTFAIGPSFLILLFLPISITIYLALVWRTFLEFEEKRWLKNKLPF